MNFTILSLSLSSLYSISPVISRHQLYIRQSNLNYFYTTALFLNPEQLTVEKSSFNYEIGSFLYSQSANIIDETFTNKDFTESNRPTIALTTNQKLLFIIRECTFNSISDSPDLALNDLNYLIFLNNRDATLYITSCTFQNLTLTKGIIFSTTRATTFSHICCSEISSNSIHDNDNTENPNKNCEGLFLRTDTPSGSFFKIIYSTIVGKNDEICARAVMHLAGSCSLRYQCINISNFNLQSSGGEFIAPVKIFSPTCFSMLMNTYY